jgi:membrane fusion protein (multidrug efflux system)
MKTLRLATLLIAIPVVPFIAACGTGEAKVPTSAGETGIAGLPVEVATPGRRDIFASYRTSSAIASDAEAPAVARVAGEVVEIMAEEGDKVVAGQILARLDGDRLRLELRHSKALLDQVSKEYDRHLQLQQKKLVSAATVEGLRFDLDRLHANHELLKLDYSYTAIRAAIAGVVSARDIKLGQYIDIHASAFRVTDPSRLVAHLKIPQGELAKFAPGHISELRVDAMPDEVFTATIARISPTIDTRNGTFRATAYIDNRQGLLAPGMFGHFRIAYERHANALTVPAAAIVNEDNESVVYVVEDGAAVRRVVATGIEADGLVEIINGLNENEQVIIAGQSGLRDGSKVLASMPAAQPLKG